MPRHTQPREVAELKGLTRKNPQRYRKQPPKSGLPLGQAPAHLNPDEAACWFELEAHSLPGVLTGADRSVMELAAKLLAESRSNWADFSAARLGHMIGLLGRLGLSPADRQKFSAAKDADTNPFDQLDS